MVKSINIKHENRKHYWCEKSSNIPYMKHRSLKSVSGANDAWQKESQQDIAYE